MDNQVQKFILDILKKSKLHLTKKDILNNLEGQFSKAELEKGVLDLKRKGEIIESKRKKLKLLEKSGKILAKITSESKNFSFAKSLDSKYEVFITKSDLKSALPGDKVIIGKIQKSEKGTKGAVEKIIETGDHIFSGKVVCGIEGLEIFCDTAVRYNIPILKGYSMGAKAGDKVKVLLSYKAKKGELGAKVIKIYGNADSAKVCSDAIIDLNEIPSTFSDEVLSQAQKIASSTIDKKEFDSRLDLRNELIFTIDGEDSKDLDDAISIKKLPNGWELGVHIADVSHYIKFNTALDKEAFKRGTSIYFADRVIPMFPESISNGICSLNEQEDKLAFSAIIILDKRGGIVDYKFVKSIINSKVRGIYSEINEILNGNAGEHIKQKYNEVKECILEAKELSDILSKNAENRGIIDILSIEPKFLLDENGKCIDVKIRPQGEAERIIENFMVTANIAAATYAKNLNLPFVYRVHEPPEARKIEDLAKSANLLGLKANKIRAGVKSSDLSDLIRQAKETESERIISRQILQTLAKARYDSKPLGHFGLSLEDYCHFTSPIRRYSDVYIHRILGEFSQEVQNNSKKDLKNHEKSAEVCAKEASLCEIRAMKAEREAEKYYMAEYMLQHLNGIFYGVISGANSKGVFIELENGVAGFMDISVCDEYNFEFDGIFSHFDKIKGKRLSIGDKIKVKLISVNIASALINFAPAEQTIKS